MANTEMFKRIRDQIKADPKTFYMSGWEDDLSAEAAEDGDWDHGYYNPSTGDYEDVMASECGTTRCIAGWAIHFEALDRGLNVNSDLMGLTNELGRIFDIPQPNYETVAMRILDTSDRSMFYANNEGGWEIVNEYANGERG